MPKITAQDPKTKSIGSIGSMTLGILEVQVNPKSTGNHSPKPLNTALKAPCFGVRPIISYIRLRHLSNQGPQYRPAKIVGVLVHGLPQKGPPVYGKSHMLLIRSIPNLPYLNPKPLSKEPKALLVDP